MHVNETGAERSRRDALFRCGGMVSVKNLALGKVWLPNPRSPSPSASMSKRQRFEDSTPSLGDPRAEAGPEPIVAGDEPRRIRRRFFTIAAAVILASTIATASWVETRVREAWMQSMGETGALYLNSALAPVIQSFADNGALEPWDEAHLRWLIELGPLAGKVHVIKLWSLDGLLLFSTSGHADHAVSAEVRLAAAGEIQIDHESFVDPHGAAHQLVEIYAALRPGGEPRPVAVGEFYQDIEALDSGLARTRTMTVAMVLVLATLTAGLLYLTVRGAERTIVAQHAAIRRSAAEASRLAKRNAALRDAARDAQLEAIATNETFLRRVGLDLHDGPIQVLTFLKLKLELEAKSGVDGRDAARLVSETLRELRELSDGLVLPDLATRSPEEIVRIAATRHADLTGTSVAVEVSGLPETATDLLRVCLYRIVQEGLSNAYKHAAGRGQRVSAGLDGENVVLRVSDAGPRQAQAQTQGPARSGIGLAGLGSRVRAIGGTLDLDRSEDGTTLTAVLPLNSSLDEPRRASA